jgi:hypothetical protein
MTQDVRRILQGIIDYCFDRWEDAQRGEDSPAEPPAMSAGRKAAYAEVIRHVRELLSECDPPSR